MTNIEIPIHPMIKLIVRINYKFGMWQKEDASFPRKIGRTIVYVVFSVGFAVSLIGGSLITDDYHESLFLFTSGLIVSVLNFKTFLNYSRAEQVLAIMQAICVHSIHGRERNELLRNINRKLSYFERFSILFLLLVVITLLTFLILFFPAFMTVKKLPFNIWFPMDWKRSSIAHWTAFFYIILCLMFNSLICMLTVVIWYIMLNCSIAYEVLGEYFRHFGASIGKERKMENHSELNELINMYQRMEFNVEKLMELFGITFFAQICTSAICICGTVYGMALNKSASIVDIFINLILVAYCLFDIFVVVFLGNEVKLLSNQLSYRLYESNWLGQTQSCCKMILILMTMVKKPRELVVGKLYPLNLDTFNMIIRGAYSLLNVLRNV